MSFIRKHGFVIALLLFSIKSIIVGIHWEDSLYFTALAALCGWQMWLEQNKEEPINDSLKKEIADLRSSVTALRIGNGVFKK